LEVHALLGTAELVHPGDAMVVLGLELMVGAQAQQENKGMLEQSAHDGYGLGDRIGAGSANMDFFRYRHKQFPDDGRIDPQIYGKTWFATPTWLIHHPNVTK
jgi:hypothetical protein